MFPFSSSRAQIVKIIVIILMQKKKKRKIKILKLVLTKNLDED